MKKLILLFLFLSISAIYGSSPEINKKKLITLAPGELIEYSESNFSFNAQSDNYFLITYFYDETTFLKEYYIHSNGKKFGPYSYIYYPQYFPETGNYCISAAKGDKNYGIINGVEYAGEGEVYFLNNVKGSFIAMLDIAYEKSSYIIINGKKYGPYQSIENYGVNPDGDSYFFAYMQNGKLYLNINGQVSEGYEYFEYVMYALKGKSYISSYTKNGKQYFNYNGKEYGPNTSGSTATLSEDGSSFLMIYEKSGTYEILVNDKVVGTFKNLDRAPEGYMFPSGNYYYSVNQKGTDELYLNGKKVATGQYPYVNPSPNGTIFLVFSTDANGVNTMSYNDVVLATSNEYLYGIVNDLGDIAHVISKNGTYEFYMNGQLITSSTEYDYVYNIENDIFFFSYGENSSTLYLNGKAYNVPATIAQYPIKIQKGNWVGVAYDETSANIVYNGTFYGKYDYVADVYLNDYNWGALGVVNDKFKLTLNGKEISAESFGLVLDSKSNKAVYFTLEGRDIYLNYVN